MKHTKRQRKKTIKNIIKTNLFVTIILGFLAGINIIYADFDLSIQKISLSNGGDIVALFSNPSINIDIKNNGPDIAKNSSNIPDGFISCTEKTSGNEVFRSSAMSTFIVNPGTNMIAGNLLLKNTLTQTPRTVDIVCQVNIPNYLDSSETNTSNNTLEYSFGVNKVGRFDLSMDRAIDPIRNNLDAAEPNSLLGGGDSIKNFIFNKIVNVVTPIIIIVGILMGIIGAYRLFFSSSADDTKKGTQLVIYGVLGIIIILSARYIGTVVFEDLFQSGNAVGLDGVDLALQLYEKIAYPFIKMIVYLALGAMFLVLASKVFSFITNSDGNAQKKAGTMIARTSISMLIIIGAKQIVEAIYGKQDQVLNQNAQTLGEIGSGILADKSIPLIYSVINWVMGLTSLIVLIIIIFQTFQILTNPDKAENRQRIGKSLAYIFIGILIIGAGYLLTNFLVIN